MQFQHFFFCVGLGGNDIQSVPFNSTPKNADFCDEFEGITNYEAHLTLAINAGSGNAKEKGKLEIPDFMAGK